MKTVAAICVAAGLLAGCSAPDSRPEDPSSASSTVAPTVQPGVMPNVVGMQWTDVNPILRKLGRINVKTNETPVNDPYQKSRIISQDPAAGAHLQPGAKITLTFGI